MVRIDGSQPSGTGSNPVGATSIFESAKKFRKRRKNERIENKSRKGQRFSC